mmetsp:Transcript_13049/g.15311  ORF Transcript_13049/g.15311 Transcript_13049/m.15311 type:complete len:572 (+) Transcript_13049:16-1731(+)
MATVVSASSFNRTTGILVNSDGLLNDLEAHNGDDILQDMDDGQLGEYKSMLIELGNFADKVLINTLSMIAEDYSDAFPKSSSNIYHAIRGLLLSRDISPDCKLPLVYVIDSILKNVKGDYIQIMQDDIHDWMGAVSQMLENDDTAQTKLRKVWNTWREFNIFPEHSWKKMGRCFLDADSKLKSAKMVTDAKLKATGIARAPDGSLQLSAKRRKQMQFVLDEMQNGDVQELNKVSLERLADINPDLLTEIKRVADEIILSAGGNSTMGGGGNSNEDSNNRESVPEILLEYRSPEVLERCAEWEKFSFDSIKSTNDTVSKLLNHVTSETSKMQVSNDKCDVAKLLGSASATATRLSNMLERLTSLENSMDTIAFPEVHTKFKTVDMSKFTTDGVKGKNDIAIACLYEVGLPCISSSDGRRFATQIELSKHLDELFRKSQNEKVMDVTQERGLYQSDLEWSGLGSDGNDLDIDLPMSNDGATSGAEASQMDDAKLATVTADDSRNKCVLCGSNFTMYCDQEEGEWKYRNCCEVNVLNNDAAEKESEFMLVHVTCLRGLGSPEFLTMDQVQNSFV